MTDKTAALTTKLGCGAIAGVIGTSIIYPLDIIKTRLQNQKAGHTIYTGMYDCASKMYRAGRMRSFYSGLAPNLVGIIPEKAIKLAVNDYTREQWGEELDCKPDQLPLLFGMLSGATAGFCQVVATNPMEVIKIQLQLAESKCQITTADIIKRIGLRGLYKGSAATLMRDVPFSIVFFSLVSILRDAGTTAGQRTPLVTVFGSGILAGGLAAALVTPMDVVKTRLQVLPKPGDHVYSGLIDCYRSLLQKEGAKALFKGVLPRVLIVSPLFAITIAIYEAQQRLFAS